MKGYISEVFSSFQGEGGSVRGSCQGRRQVFVRFAGCNLAVDKRPCVWCDSPEAQKPGAATVKVEKKPGSMEFETLSNPLDVDKMISIIRSLKTPDLHSLSLTGGEPLFQPEFLMGLLEGLDEPVYLETNGTLPKAAETIAQHVDYASVDVKDQSALPYAGWDGIVEKELETIKILNDGGARVFAKVVVTDETEPSTISWIAKELDGIGVPLAIQPVTTREHKLGITPRRLAGLSEAAAQYLSARDISLSLQTHKFQGLL